MMSCALYSAWEVSEKPNEMWYYCGLLDRAEGPHQIQKATLVKLKYHLMEVLLVLK